MIETLQLSGWLHFFLLLKFSKKYSDWFGDLCEYLKLTDPVLFSLALSKGALCLLL